jgi:hypothetical protein
MLLEALVAFVLAVLVLAVFHGPAWSIQLGQFGGLGFAFYVLILLLEWMIGRVKNPQRNPTP